MKKLLILLVEDSEEWINVILPLLEKEGHSIHVGMKYAEVTTRFSIEKYDLLIVDLALGPEPNNRDGVFLLEEAFLLGIPSVVITSHDSREMIEKANRFDAMRFISKKSFYPEEFKKQISQISELQSHEPTSEDKKLVRKLFDDLISGDPIS